MRAGCRCCWHRPSHERRAPALKPDGRPRQRLPALWPPGHRRRRHRSRRRSAARRSPDHRPRMSRASKRHWPRPSAPSMPSSAPTARRRCTWRRARSIWARARKIIVPAITFLATASAPHLNGAEIVFADVDPDTGLMGAGASRGGAVARAGDADAVFNVHLNGQCGDWKRSRTIARAHGAKIVDDACHALGTAYVAEDGAVSAHRRQRASAI